MKSATYDWAAIRADAATMTSAELCTKYNVKPATLAWKRSEDKRCGNPWSVLGSEITARKEAAAAYRTERGLPIAAAFAPKLEPVPVAIEKLPWTRYPRDATTARVLAGILDHLGQSAEVKKLGAEAVAFCSSHAEYLRALAVRSEAPVTAPTTQPFGDRCSAQTRKIG